MVDGYMHFSLCLEYIIDVTFVAAKLQKKGVLALGIYFFLSELGGFLSASLLGGCVRTYFFLSYIPQSLAQTAGRIAPWQAAIRIQIVPFVSK
jgi:hypothetical protein